MPTYRFQPLSGNGQAATSFIDAPDRAAAVRLLRDRGITPASLEPVEGRAARVAAVSEPAGVRGVPSALGARAAMSKTEMANFVNELATAVGAGLTLVQAMKTLERSGRSARQKEMLAFLIHELEHGKAFSDAAEAWGKPFTDLVVSLIRAGEVSGKLGEVLTQAAVLLDREVKLRRALIGATIYPAILLALVCGAIAVVVTVIVPQVLQPLAGRIRFEDLPLPTRVVSHVATFFSAYWWAVLGAIVVACLVWPRMYRQPATRLAVDDALIRVPVLGRLLKDVAVARFTRTLGTLVSAGLPALTALRATKATLGNKAMEELIDGVCEQVAAGKTISEPLEEAGGGGVFPPLLVQIVGVGERSGRLPQLLLQAADAMESRTEQSMKLFTTVLPPMIVVLLAGVVGFVISAVVLALLQMQEMIG